MIAGIAYKTAFYATVPISSSMRGGGPRVVATDTPHMAFKIEASKTPAPIVFILNCNDNLSTKSEYACMHFIGIADQNISALCFHAANFIGLFHVATEWRIGDGT